MSTLPDSSIPYGYCGCGCGEMTRISERNRYNLGHRKGEPLPYLFGHQTRRSHAYYVQRFWSLVEKGPDCWRWIGPYYYTGYGQFTASRTAGDSARKTTAHRMAWEIANGPAPEGAVIRHHCDHRWCVNPAHLVLGTREENATDYRERGSHSYRRRRISVAERQEMRDRYAAGGETYKSLAVAFKLHQQTVYRILEGTRSRNDTSSVQERFWQRVLRGDGCWLWQGAVNANGYGSFSPRDGKVTTAHRFSWVLANGCIAPNLDVCHACDVRLCVRPDHLWLGTRAENMRDAVRKGRIAHGDRHGSKTKPRSVAR